MLMEKTIPEDFNLVSYLTEKRDQAVFIWIFNIGAEKYWSQLPGAAIDRNEEAIVNRIEEINLLLCRRQDYVILRRQPHPFFLETLEELGFAIPEILTVAGEDPYTPICELALKDALLIGRLKEIAGANTAVYLVPYGVTRLEEELAKQCNIPLGAASAGITARVNDKIFCRGLLTALNYAVPEGKVCTDLEAIKTAYRSLSPEFKQVIIKEPCNASGKGLYLIDNAEMLDALLPRLGRFSRKIQEPRWIVEGWYEKQADINYQVYIAPNGAVTLFSLKEQILRQTVYIGSQYPAGLEPETQELYAEYAQGIGKYLHRLGYYGVAGIDSIIAANKQIFPAIEINGRFTLSTYISFIPRQLDSAITYLTRYFKIVTGKSIDYRELTGLLEKEEILYTRQKGEGVFIYCSAAAPVHSIPGSNLFSGRIFSLILAANKGRLEYFNSALEKVLAGIARNLSV